MTWHEGKVIFTPTPLTHNTSLNVMYRMILSPLLLLLYHHPWMNDRFEKNPLLAFHSFPWSLAVAALPQPTAFGFGGVFKAFTLTFPRTVGAGALSILKWSTETPILYVWLMGEWCWHQVLLVFVNYLNPDKVCYSSFLPKQIKYFWSL